MLPKKNQNLSEYYASDNFILDEINSILTDINHDCCQKQKIIEVISQNPNIPKEDIILEIKKNVGSINAVVEIQLTKLIESIPDIKEFCANGFKFNNNIEYLHMLPKEGTFLIKDIFINSSKQNLDLFILDCYVKTSNTISQINYSRLSRETIDKLENILLAVNNFKKSRSQTINVLEDTRQTYMELLKVIKNSKNNPQFDYALDELLVILKKINHSDYLKKPKLTTDDWVLEIISSVINDAIKVIKNNHDLYEAPIATMVEFNDYFIVEKFFKVSRFGLELLDFLNFW